jgi:hypothetical protein
MAKSKLGLKEVFEQTSDEVGRLRLDRPLTAEEAASQDEEHRKRYLANRARRFFGPTPKEIGE